ncbi:Ig-like domain-containing protein, partial [Granulicatella sp. HMSC30F09]|uniref:Ig-like domain-containing protein n=1 Tax=Granulicatella sp. HMSC30F09 TaxID=1581071 RepID=UPI001AEF7247
DKTSTGKQGKKQKETPQFTAGDPEVPLTIDASNPVKFIDPTTNEPTDKTELPAMKDGKQVGTYKLNPTTGEVTFTPNKDFVGTPEGVTVQAKDANGTPATAKYTPTVTEVTPSGEDKTSTGKQGKEQKETPQFTAGDPDVPMKIDGDQPAKFIDPETGDPTDKTELPAMKDGKEVGTYKLNPTTGEVTFTPNKDFVGTP